jgi:hypothetical protein
MCGRAIHSPKQNAPIWLVWKWSALDGTTSAPISATSSSSNSSSSSARGRFFHRGWAHVSNPRHGQAAGSRCRRSGCRGRAAQAQEIRPCGHDTLGQSGANQALRGPHRSLHSIQARSTGFSHKQRKQRQRRGRGTKAGTQSNPL